MKKKGFTLLEMIIVIALIGILMILIIPNVTKLFKSSKKKTFVTQVQSLATIAEQTIADDLANGNISINSYAIYVDSATESIFRSALSSGDPEDEEDDTHMVLKQLNIEKPGVKYVYVYVGGALMMMGYSDENYCYYKDYRTENMIGSLHNSNNYLAFNNVYLAYDRVTSESRRMPSISINIDEGDVGIGGTLTFVEAGFACVGSKFDLPVENGTLYWTENSVDPSRVPSNAVNNYDNFDDTFIKSVISNGEVVKHEACAKRNGNVFCFGMDYWTTDVETTMNKLNNDLITKLGYSEPYCFTEENLAVCKGEDDYYYGVNYDDELVGIEKDDCGVGSELVVSPERVAHQSFMNKC